MVLALCSRSSGKLVIIILPEPFLAGPIQSTYLFYLDVQICAPPEAQEASLVNEAGVTRAVPWIVVWECVVVIRIVAAYIIVHNIYLVKLPHSKWWFSRGNLLFQENLGW